MTTALITGASSGIGSAFAEAFARRQTSVILVARSEDRLQALADRLTRDFGIQAWVLPYDLTRPEAASTVAQQVDTWGLTVDVLVNNAGFGDYGPFGDRPRQRHIDMIQLNIAALVDLTYQFLPAMRERQSGTIINVSSIAGFQPMPYLATYAATKAFVLSFSEALWAEVQTEGVRVTALCPGPTETEFFKSAEFPSSMAEGTPQSMATPETVVEDALRAIDDQTPSVVSGDWLNHLVVNMSRFFPRSTTVKILEQQFRPPSDD